VLADRYGNVIVVGTATARCSGGTKKLVEEAPAPFLSPAQRETIHAAAQGDLPRGGLPRRRYVEFLVGTDGTISFLEVNTRLQVEHPVTEETSGIDLVREQFRIADGGASVRGADPSRAGTRSSSHQRRGPRPRFLPAPGTVSALAGRSGPGVAGGRRPSEAAASSAAPSTRCSPRSS